MKYLYTILLLGPLFPACKNDGSNTYSDHISAKIVESTSPSLGSNAWFVASEPELTFGTEEGDENLQFYRVFSVIQLSSGNIVVSNSGTHELRFFDLNGNFIKSTGQNGRGPGDFGDWSSMNLHKYSDDAFIVNDNSNNRGQIFSNDGELITVNSIEKIKNAGNPSITDVFTDNSWLVWSVIGSAAITGNPGEIVQHEVGFHRLFPDWNYDKMLFKIPARPRYVNEYQGITNYPFIPLTAEPIYITDSTNAVLFSKASEPTITRVDTTGNYTHTYKWDLTRIKTDSIWDRYKQEYYLDPLSSYPDRKAQYEHLLSEDLPIPENIPAISALKIDAEDNVWAKRFVLPWDETEVWDVLSSSGNWLTSIKIPQGFTVTEIGSDYLLGYTQKNGFLEIVKFPLIKNS
jgi:hypothetical protein